MLGVTAQVASARPAHSGSFRWSGGPKPVIVLEHGAWADASGWDQVIRLLREDNFTVYAPPNPLRGLPQDSASLHAFLTQNAALAGQPVVLVGHSYGGAVITNAADGDPAVKALVYVDAFIPDQGETLLQLVSAQPGSYEFLSFRNVAACGSTSSFNRRTLPGVARYRGPLAPHLLPILPSAPILVPTASQLRVKSNHLSIHVPVRGRRSRREAASYLTFGRSCLRGGVAEECCRLFIRRPPADARWSEARRSHRTRRRFLSHGQRLAG